MKQTAEGFICIGVTLAIGMLLVSCGGGTGGSNVTVTGDLVELATEDLDVEFTKGDSISETYMLFGGLYMSQKNAISKVTFSGLPIETAKAIAGEYPDFYRCSSPGAAQAMGAVVQLDTVSADGKTLKILKGALDTFNKNLRLGGDRVCVKLTGSELELDSVTVRENNQDLSDPFRSMQFILVTEAEMISGQEALEAP